VKTGNLVHIDFGVAFDQGKILPTPETVPFRLTQDIVDGFGPQVSVANWPIVRPRNSNGPNKK
jgi:hypothetical protein